jgi:hypothetical protein
MRSSIESSSPDADEKVWGLSASMNQTHLSFSRAGAEIPEPEASLILMGIVTRGAKFKRTKRRQP